MPRVRGTGTGVVSHAAIGVGGYFYVMDGTVNHALVDVDTHVLASTKSLQLCDGQGSFVRVKIRHVSPAARIGLAVATELHGLVEHGANVVAFRGIGLLTVDMCEKSHAEGMAVHRALFHTVCEKSVMPFCCVGEQVIANFSDLIRVGASRWRASACQKGETGEGGHGDAIARALTGVVGPHGEGAVSFLVLFEKLEAFVNRFLDVLRHSLRTEG